MITLEEIYEKELHNLLKSKERYSIYFIMLQSLQHEDYCVIWVPKRNRNLYYFITKIDVNRNNWTYVDINKCIPINLIDECLEDSFFEMLKADKAGLLAMLKIFYNDLIKKIGN